MPCPHGPLCLGHPPQSPFCISTCSPFVKTQAVPPSPSHTPWRLEVLSPLLEVQGTNSALLFPPSDSEPLAWNLNQSRCQQAFVGGINGCACTTPDPCQSLGLAGLSLENPVCLHPPSAGLSWPRHPFLALSVVVWVAKSSGRETAHSPEGIHLPPPQVRVSCLSQSLPSWKDPANAMGVSHHLHVTLIHPFCI